MKIATLGAAGLALSLLAGCGGAETNPGQPSADENQKLDDIARKLDENAETFDTSPDSLVPANEAEIEGNGAANLAAPSDAPPANQANAAEPR